VLEETQCFPGRFRRPVEGPEFAYEPAKQRWGQIYAGLAMHFVETLKTTSVDARHDAVFGLALYAMSLVASAMRPHSTRPSGRHLLRSLAEVHITLAYLVTKDEPELWQTYRANGTGQAKLAFLKLVERERDDLPGHVDLGVLERLANEDMWQEFVEMDFGHWAGLTVRKMAEDAGSRTSMTPVMYGRRDMGTGIGQLSAIQYSIFALTHCIDSIASQGQREST
jgi:hypothetical protein